jgi:hypothetical protein
MGQSWRARLELAWIRGVFALPGMRWLYLRFVWSAGGELEADRQRALKWIRQAERAANITQEAATALRGEVEREYQLAKSCLVLGDGDGHMAAVQRMVETALLGGRE